MVCNSQCVRRPSAGTEVRKVIDEPLDRAEARMRIRFSSIHGASMSRTKTARYRPLKCEKDREALVWENGPDSCKRPTGMTRYG